MFQFPGFPSHTYWFSIRYMILHHVRSRIRKSAPMLICSHARLIAACHVLHRLPMPRHSPYALLCLNSLISVLFFSLNCCAISSYSYFSFLAAAKSYFFLPWFYYSGKTWSCFHISLIFSLASFKACSCHKQFSYICVVHLFGFQWAPATFLLP